MSSDPIIELLLKEPLSGWSLEALSIQKWSIDTLLIFLALIMMIWTLTSKTPGLFKVYPISLWKREVTLKLVIPILKYQIATEMQKTH